MSCRHSAALTGALTATMGVSALLTSGVSALGPALRADLMLSRFELGLFSMVVFLTAAVTSIPWGILADRISPRWGMSLTFFLAITGMFGVASADSLPIFLVAAAAGGCSLALSATITNKLVSQFVDPRHRGRELSTKQMGVQFAQVIAGFLFPWIAVAYSWRMGLGSGVAISLVALLLIFLTTRRSFVEPAEKSSPVIRDQRPGEPGNNRLLLAMVVYALVTALCFQSNLFGLPLMGVEVIDFEVQTASKVVVVFGVVGFITRLVWGRFADRPFRIRLVMQVLGFGLLLGEIFVLLAIQAQLTWAFWIGAVLAGTAFSLVPVVLSAVILQDFTPTRVGVISGVISVSTFGGFAAGPLMFGTMTDHFGYSYASSILVGAALIAMLAPFLLRNERGTAQPTSVTQDIPRSQVNLEI